MKTAIRIAKNITVMCWIIVVTITSIVFMVKELLPTTDEWQGFVISLSMLFAIVGAFLVIMPKLMEGNNDKKP